MRIRAFDKRGYEDLAKPHMPAMNQNEKEKIVEQYVLAKRQVNNGLSPRFNEMDSNVSSALIGDVGNSMTQASQ